jgi:hypothetical protein
VTRESDRGTIPDELMRRLWEQAQVKSPREEGQHLIMAVYMNETGIVIPMSSWQCLIEGGKFAPGLCYICSQIVVQATFVGLV